MRQEETKVRLKILAWLKKHNFIHWRQNAGMANVQGRWIVLGKKGLPDICVILPPYGRFLGLEVKTDTGRLRPAQAEFAERVCNIGGIYRIVRSLECVKTILRELGHEPESRSQRGIKKGADGGQGAGSTKDVSDGLRHVGNRRGASR